MSQVTNLFICSLELVPGKRKGSYFDEILVEGGLFMEKDYNEYLLVVKVSQILFAVILILSCRMLLLKLLLAS